MNNNSATDKDPVVEYVVKEFKRYELHWEDRFNKAMKAYDMWRGIPQKRPFDWQNAVHVPLMVEGEQTLTPRIYGALFPNDAPLDVRVEGDADPKDGIVLSEGLKHFFRAAEVEGKMLPVVSQAVLYGTGYAEAGTWLVRRGWQIDDQGGRNYRIVEARPDFNHVSFFEMYPHPAKMNMTDGLPLIRRRFIDAEQLKTISENPIFKFTKLSTALKSENKEGSYSKILGPDGKPELLPREDYEVLEYWGPWDLSYKDDKGEAVVKKAVPHWIIVINRDVCVRMIPNPYRHQRPPFIKIKLFEDLKPNWFGVGLGDLGESSQDRVDKLVNQRLDNVDLVLNKQGVFDGNDILLNPKSLLISKPGKWHKVSDVNMSMKPFEFQDVTQSAYMEEKVAKDDFKEATGATIPLQPNDKSQQHRTAIGIQLLQGAAGERFKPVLTAMEIDGLKAVGEFFYSLLGQFMTRGLWVDVAGQKNSSKPMLTWFDQSFLDKKVKFVPVGISETMNKEMQVGQLLRFKEITMNDPTVNRAEINKRIAELMAFKDIDKLIVQQPTTPQMHPGALDPEMQAKIRQRQAEGASPDQIKAEMIGPPPGPGGVGPQGGGGPQPEQAPQGIPPGMGGPQ